MLRIGLRLRVLLWQFMAMTMDEVRLKKWWKRRRDAGVGNAPDSGSREDVTSFVGSRAASVDIGMSRTGSSGSLLWRRLTSVDVSMLICRCGIGGGGTRASWWRNATGLNATAALDWATISGANNPKGRSFAPRPGIDNAQLPSESVSLAVDAGDGSAQGLLWPVGAGATGVPLVCSGFNDSGVRRWTLSRIRSNKASELDTEVDDDAFTETASILSSSPCSSSHALPRERGLYVRKDGLGH